MMQSTIRGAAIAIFLVMLGAIAQAQSADVPRASLAALSEKLARSEIDRVDIFAIPARVFSRTVITPEAIETTFHYRFTIRMLRGSGYEADVRRVVRSLSVRQSAETPDLRWGMVFHDLEEKRVAAIYLDGRGAIGVVDRAVVSIQGELFDWLEQEFSPLLR
jgi:hypothetical protein